MTQFLLRAILFACLLIGARAYAGDIGTPDEAKSMALRAADFLRQSGPDTAFPVFNAKNDAQYHERDLYVMVYDDTGKNVSNGANPAQIGKDLLDLKDTDGKPLIREFVAIKDQAWVDYKWPDPINKKIMQKTTYVVRVGHYLVGVGAYK